MILHYPRECLILTTFSNGIRRNWVTNAPMQDAYTRETGWGGQIEGWSQDGNCLYFCSHCKTETALTNIIY